jgi:hypothetical protein
VPSRGASASISRSNLPAGMSSFSSAKQEGLPRAPIATRRSAGSKHNARRRPNPEQMGNCPCKSSRSESVIRGECNFLICLLRFLLTAGSWAYASTKERMARAWRRSLSLAIRICSLPCQAPQRHDYRCYGSGNLRTTFRARTGKISLLLTRKRVNSSWTRH